MDISVEHRGGEDYVVRVGAQSKHAVRAGPQALARVTRPGDTPEQSVIRAFHFLLERESPESILASFALEDIARYFPEFWSEMSRA
ncbi:MAG: hypothetical protein ABR564_03810 [Candidatus Dormibacteria bacterium]